MADTTAPGTGSTRHLDRFGLVLILTIAAIVLLSTIEIPSSIDTASATWRRPQRWRAS